MADTSDRVALPVRVHEFLLACAGRIDDDALTDARELLAVAELDRAIELLTASLVAGRIAVTADEREELRELVDAVRSAPALVDRIIVDETAYTPRHRFTAGTGNDPAPDAGVADAIGRVVEVLPDIRAVSCVWRTTPAGAPAGPVPQRLVLVETGPNGFAPSTAYRVEQALRRAGIRASVEVIESGTEVPNYHADALTTARRVSLRTTGTRAADVPKAVGGQQAPGGSMFDDPPAPRPVTTTRRRAAGAHAEKRQTADTASGRWQRRVGVTEPGDQQAPSEPPTAPRQPAAPVGRASTSSTALPPVPPPPGFDQSGPRQRQDPAMSSAMPPVVPPAPPSPVPPPPPSSPGPSSSVQSEPPVAKAEPAAPPRPSRPEPQAEVSEPVDSTPARPAEDDPDSDLSNRERELLRQLHEELAKREVSDEPADRPSSPPSPPAPQERPSPGTWQVDRSGGTRHGAYAPGGSAWQHASEQTAVNGIPPYGSQPG